MPESPVLLFKHAKSSGSKNVRINIICNYQRISPLRKQDIPPEEDVPKKPKIVMIAEEVILEVPRFAHFASHSSIMSITDPRVKGM